MIEQYFKKLNDLAVKNAFFTVYSIANGDEDHFRLILENVSSFCKKLSIDPTYHSFLKVCMEDFLKQNWVVQMGNTTRLTPSGRSILQHFSQEQLIREIEEIGKEDQNLKSYASLLSLCCYNTRAILQGDHTAQEILFQDETLLPQVYGNNSIADSLHKEMGQLLQERVLDQRNRETKKILEIGAGTGATTRFLLPLFEQSQIRWEYTFSDISPHFVNLAQTSRNFDPARFHFITLDLNKLSELKSKLETYDFIIGTNVLHACTDVKNVLKNLVEILKPSGGFIFGEITTPEAYLTYTFGLLKDWWQQTPQPYRFSHSPLISIENWKSIFREAGLDGFKWIIPRNTPWQTAFFAGKKAKSELTTDSAIKKLQEGIAAILVKSVEKINIHHTFAELGIDSLLILTLIGKIQKEFGVKLRASDIFDFPTIAKLAAHLKHKVSFFPLLEERNISSSLPKELPLSTLQPYLKEHQYKDRGMMPVDGWVKLICDSLEEKKISFHNLLFLKPFFTQETKFEKGLSIKLLPEAAFTDRFSGEISSDQDVYVEFTARTKVELPKKTIDLPSPSNPPIVTESELFASERMKIGESYRAINTLSYSSSGFVCFFNKNRKVPIHFAPFQPYLHSLITCALKFPSFSRKKTFDFFLPSLVKTLNISGDLKSEEIDHGIGILKEELEQSYSFDLYLCDEKNEALCSLENFQISFYEKISPPKIMDSNRAWQSPLLRQEKVKDEIAIIGMSGLFAKAKNTEEFWKVLETGSCLVGNLPEKRREGFGHSAFKAAYIPEIDSFDHEFFHLCSQEAKSMDPQQRLLLEQSYRAFEDAGYPKKRREKIKNSCGIFIGASSGDYLHHLLSTGQEPAAQAFWGNAPSVLSGRLSYYFDFHGPALGYRF